MYVLAGNKLGCLNVELLILGYKYSSSAEQIGSEVIPNSASLTVLLTT